jgi:hypothetical protein
MHLYLELVCDPAFQLGQECRESVKLEQFVRRLLEWDGVSEDLPQRSRSTV